MGSGKGVMTGNGTIGGRTESNVAKGIEKMERGRQQPCCICREARVLSGSLFSKACSIKEGRYVYLTVKRTAIVRND